MKHRILLLTLAFSLHLCAFASDASKKLLSLMLLKPEQTTTAKVTTLLGTPNKIEESGKLSIWHYDSDASRLELYWNHKTNILEKYSYSATPAGTMAWDNTKASFLKTGETGLAQVIKILGIPKDMTIKTVNQQLHYAFQDNVLNLFFHKGTLVNFTLY